MMPTKDHFFSKRGIYDLYDDILMILKLLNIWYWIVWKRFSLVYYTFVINVKWNGESNKTSTQNDFICFIVSEKGSCKSFEAIMSSKLCDILLETKASICYYVQVWNALGVLFIHQIAYVFLIFVLGCCIINNLVTR